MSAIDYAQALAEGDRLYQAGQAEPARRGWLQARTLADTKCALLTIANRFLSLGFLTETEQTLALLPDSDQSAPFLATRSALALEKGDIMLARADLEKASSQQNLRLMSNALLLRHYETPINAKALLLASQNWAAQARVQTPPLVADKPVARGTRLRIGFVSGDLCAHPVGFLIAPLLRTFGQFEEVDIYVFDNGNQNDWMTGQLKACCLASQWYDIAPRTDADVAHLIRSCCLDVLIDCSGHTSRSRLALFRNRLAPLQLSWGGYFSTTGLTTIDAVIMDEFHLAQGIDEFFVEKLIKVPSRFIYTPPPFVLPVTDAPVFRNGYITFGSFNNIAKINDDVVATWSKILLRVPQARLVLKWRGFADAAFCAVMRDRFRAHGIEPLRLDFRPFSTYRDTLVEYRDIDIALDPFPFTGGQTSLDALWMGVPLVTLAGFMPVERQGHAFVHLIGRPDWSVVDCEHYVQTAIGLAHDADALRTMRFEQRELIRSSPLSDATRFVTQFLKWITAQRSSPNGRPNDQRL